MGLPTVTVQDVEILATGTHNGRQFTTSDLDKMVEAFQALKGKLDPPVKLGHDDSQKLLQKDGYPAAGWIAGLKRVGDKVLATLTDVPKAIADLMAAKAYRKRSVEVYFDWKFEGKVWPIVLRGLALLGEDIPAVKTLDDIRKLYDDRGIESWPSTFMVMTDADDMPVLSEVDYLLNELLEDLGRWLEKAEGGIKGKYGSPAIRTYLREVRGKLQSMMKTSALAASDRADLIWEETENQIRHSVRPPDDFEPGSFRTVPLQGVKGVSIIVGRLKGETTSKTQSVRFDKGADWTLAKAKDWMSKHDFASDERQVIEMEDLKKFLGLAEDADDKAVDKALTDLKAAADQMPALTEKVKALEDEAAKNKGGDKVTLTEVRALQDQVGKLQGELATRDATAAVAAAIQDGKILPAQKEWADAYALKDLAGFQKFVAAQPKVVDTSTRGVGPDGSLNLADLEPTQAEIEAAKSMGIWSDEHRIKLIRLHAEEKGVTLPADFGKPKDADSKDKK